MRYAAVLNGQANLFESVAACFASDAARIKKLGETWVLESSTFNSCGEPTEVFPIADRILGLIHRILALYCNLDSVFTVAYVQAFTAEGRPSRRGIRGAISVTVISARGIAELANQSGGQPLGSTIAQKAASDPAVDEALNLRGDFGWSHVYDIIEFLGGADGISRAGWATKKRTREVRQTANHFRHLGSPKASPLPLGSPTIDEARVFAGDLLKRWIASRL
jgi:hypothetical protein